MKASAILAMLAFTAAVILPGCKSRQAQPAPPQPSEQESVPSEPSRSTDFVLMDQDGREVRLADYSGKIVVLEWTNPECPFVQRHVRLGTMKTLAGKYADRGVVWLAINTTHTFNQAKNKTFHTQQQLPYPVLDDHTGQG